MLHKPGPWKIVQTGTQRHLERLRKMSLHISRGSWVAQWLGLGARSSSPEKGKLDFFLARKAKKRRKKIPKWIRSLNRKKKT